ncbi:TRAP transporter substrate-binding protein [Halalkalibacter krulwichiae]|uniref:C4-dicarboxylate-binding periplasmic protein n=1 Tax=Halalkalibacter krulwichiae TaxID=199441 RepID=A0A1X9M8K1_9BACI|nr:TRAP transporter substrate-binding protein [Halalkalibacter krulwichiae]ARK29738.1 C4-dicarboxylate-binding periplasmic protein precursor [Halalkalibacter krulwichiae]
MKKVVSLFSTAFLAVSILAACGGSNDASTESADNSGDNKETVTLTLAENQPEDYPTTVGAKEFARLVEEKTDGRYKIEVYAGGQLGDERSVIEQLQLGTIDLTRVNGIPLSEFSSDIGVLAMPYLFENEEEKWEVLNGEIGQDLLETFDGSSLVGLAFYDSGERSFYNTQRPVTTPEDLEGLQIRVQQSDLAIDIINSLGGSATPMEYGEVYSALQTGVIDGAENNFPSYFTSNHYEVAQYFTVNGYQGVPEVLLSSEKLWNSLSAEDQEAFREAALESVDIQRQAWAELVEEARDVVLENGSELVEVEDVTAWREAVQPVYDKYGEQFGEWLDRINAN